MAQGAQQIKKMRAIYIHVNIYIHIHTYIYINIYTTPGVRMAQGAQQIKKMRAIHMKRNKNAIFYCTTTEIDYGNLNTTNWGPIFEQMCSWQEQVLFIHIDDDGLDFMIKK
jgi:hypothetical protein